jgi:sugar phosphate isomerase/epimerase
MATSEIGLSMLYCLGAPFKKMVEEIPKVQASYIEIIDDGLHALDKKKTVKLNEIGKSHGTKYAVHAPFAGINISLPSRPLLNATLKRLKESIVNASALGLSDVGFSSGNENGHKRFLS